MTDTKAAKPLLAFERASYKEHGYTFTRFTIYRGIEKTPIAEQIALSATPCHYSDQATADRMVAHYRQLQNNGVTHVFTSSWEWVNLVFQHSPTRDNGFILRVELTDNPRYIDACYRVWRDVQSRLLRAGKKSHSLYGPSALEYQATPDLLVTVLDRMKCEPIAALRTERCSHTLISPIDLPLLEQWSIA